MVALLLFIALLPALAAPPSASTMLPAATPSPGSWLDTKPLVGWNVPGASLPRAPQRRGDSPRTGVCAKIIRTAQTPEDRAVSKAGWTVFGPYELFSGTSLVLGMTSVDGMCRPLQYQGFVFVNRTFAGTLSPAVMDSRSDGDVQPLLIFSPSEVHANFSRYRPSDPLCCPSRTTSVTYHIEHHDGHAVLVPLDAATSRNAS